MRIVTVSFGGALDDRLRLGRRRVDEIDDDRLLDRLGAHRLEETQEGEGQHHVQQRHRE